MENKHIDTNKIIDSYSQKITAQSDTIHTVLDAGGSITNHLYDSYSKYYLSQGAHFAKSDRVLDFGCGLGRLTEYFAPKVKSIVGVDISPHLIELAQKRNTLPNCSYQTIIPGQQITGEYDKILFFGVFLHLDDETLQTTLQNFHDILSPNGQIIFIEPVYNKDFQLNEQVIYRTSETLIPFFEQANFTFLEEKKVIRIPSYSFHILKKIKWTAPFMLTLCRKIEEATMERRPEHVELFWKRFIFQKLK